MVGTGRTRIVRLLVAGIGLAVVGTLGGAFLSPSSAEDALEGKSMVLSDATASGDGSDLRTTSADVRTFINGYFDDLSTTDPLPLKVPGFELGSAVSMDDASLRLNCGTENYVTFEGPFSVDGTSIDAKVALRWESSGSTIPSVEIDLDATSTLADPIFEVSTLVDWIVDLTGTDAAGLDGGLLGGADVELRQLQLHYKWAEDETTELDATAESYLFQSTTAELSDDLAIGFLLSLRVPDGEDATLLAGLHLDNADPTADHFTLGALLRGAPGELATSIELPEMYLATVQPAGHSVSVLQIAQRPLVKAFFDDHGPDVEGLPEQVVGEPFEFSSDVTIAAEANLDFLGEGLRDAFGYGEGATATAVGTLDLTFEDINTPSPSVDFEGVDIDIALPNLNGAAAALLPDWVNLSDLAVNIGWDADPSAPSLLVSVDADAAIAIADPSQPAPAHQVQIDTHLSAELMVVTELDGGVSTSLGLRGETVGEPGTPIWPHPFGQSWLNLNSLGAELVLIAPAGQPLSVSGKVTSSFDIGGKTFVFTAAIDVGDTETAVVLNLSLHDTVSLADVIHAFQPAATLPKAFDTMTVGPADEDEAPVSLTLRLGFPNGSSSAAGISVYAALNTPATFNVTGDPSVEGLRMGFLFSFRSNGTDPPVFTIGGRLSETTLLGALEGILPAELAAAMAANGLDLTLPDIGVVFTSAGLELSSDVIRTTAPEEYEFFRHLYGCGAEPADPACRFDVDLDGGIHFLTSISPKDPSSSEPMFGPYLSALGMDPNSALLVQASLAFPAPGSDAELGSLALRLILPVKPATPPDWFHSAGLSIGVSASSEGLALYLEGELKIRIADERVATSDAGGTDADCEEPKLWVPRAGTSPAIFACYDVLEFLIGGEVELSTSGSASVTIYGSFVGNGWQPFGIDFVAIGTARLELSAGIDATGQPQFNMGLLVSGKLFEKDFAGSIIIGVRIVPAAPSPIPVPDFKGLQLSSTAGLETADVVKLYDFLRVRLEDARTAAQVLNDTYGLGIEVPNLTLPHFTLDQAGLPNISVRDLHLNVGLVSNPELCIDLGLKLSGALYIGAEALDGDDVPVPDPCTTPPPPPEECLNYAVDPCFASVQIEATLEGLIYSGGLGEFGVGPLHWDQALLDFRLTPTVQRFRVYGGATIDGIGSGGIDLTIASDGLAFLGDIDLPAGFHAMVEGEFGVNFTPTTSIEDLVGVDFYVHALLEADFAAMIEDAIGPPLQDMRNTAAGILAVYDTFKHSNGDVLATFGDLPGVLTAHDVPVPTWLTLLGPPVASTVTTIQTYGLDPPTLGQLLNGFEVTAGIPGFLDTSVDPPSCNFGTGTIVEGNCYSTPPHTFTVGGFCHLPGLVGVLPCTTAGFLTLLEGPLVDALNDADIPGTDFSTMVEGLLGDGTVGVPPLALECADFEAQVSSDADSFVDLRLRASVFSTIFGFEHDWDLAGDPVDQAVEFVDEVIAILLGTADEPRCLPLGQITIAGGGRGIATDEDAPLDPPERDPFTLHVAPRVIDEGQSVTLTGTFEDTWEDDDPVTIHWTGGRHAPGSGHDTTVGELRDGVTHTYPDDDPPVTTSDLETISASAVDGKIRASAETSVVIRNVAPSAVALTVSGGDNELDEAEAFTLQGSFADPGTEDRHTVTVDWGDGTPATVLALDEGDRAFQAGHTFADDRPTATDEDLTRIRVTVADDDSGAASATRNVTVRNVAPTAVAVSPVADVDEGALVTYTVTFTDPGTADTHVATIAWGDGTSSTVPVSAGARTVAAQHRYADDPPSGTPTGSSTATVTVTDDDTGAGSRSQAIETDNVDPSSVTISAARLAREGESVPYDVRFVDPGTGDTHTALITWGDGTTQPVAIPPGARGVRVVHTYADDPPTATPTGSYEATVRVEDDDTGAGLSAATALPVENVAPSATLVATRTTTENSTGLVTATVSWSDAGVLDSHTVRIDWGYGPTTAFTRFTDSEVLPPGTTSFQATRVFGDDGTFLVRATVTDDDTGAATKTSSVVVANVAPTLAMNETGTIDADGGPTFLVRKGSSLSLSGTAGDVGSDDLRFSWNWADGTAVATSTVRPPGQSAADADPSPEVNPNLDRTFTTSHTWARPCLYDTTLGVDDFDGGTASDNIHVVVTGTDTKRQITGWWAQQYLPGSRNKTDLDDTTLLPCYLKIAGHMSRVFGNAVPLSTATDALKVLDTSGPSDDTRALDRQLLASWLNFAHGSVGWTALVDTNCDRVGDTRFNELITAAEAERTRANATKAALIAYKTKLECVNR